MAIKVLFFGQLTDVTGSQSLEIENIADTNALQQKLQELYPALIHTQYRIAVDKQIITENTLLHQAATAALLPPFSGG